MTTAYKVIDSCKFVIHLDEIAGSMNLAENGAEERIHRIQMLEGLLVCRFRIDV